MYGLAATEDYDATGPNGMVPLIATSNSIQTLRAITDYNPFEMDGSHRKSAMALVEDHPLNKAGFPVGGGIYDLR
jgi:hypothetical protein